MTAYPFVVIYINGSKNINRNSENRVRIGIRGIRLLIGIAIKSDVKISANFNEICVKKHRVTEFRYKNVRGFISNAK